MNQAIKMGGGQRNSNVDCFKILLMVMIVAHHGIVHGIEFERIQDATVSNQFGLIYFEANAFLGIAVNCFFWVSGYYQIKRRISRAIELITETMLYVLLLNVVLCLTNNYSITNFLDVIRIIKRVLLFYQGYWFLSAYLIVFIFAPYLNKMVSVLSPNEKKEALVSLVLVGSICGFILKIASLDNGYSTVQGIYMYLVGSLCRTDDIQSLFKSKCKMLKVAFVILGLLNGLLAYAFNVKGNGTAAWRMFSYNNPIMVFMAIIACLSVIYWTKKPKVFDNFGKWSRHTLAVYILTDYISIRKLVFSPLNHLKSMNGLWIIAFIFLYASLLTLICIGIDCIRKNLYDSVEKRFL